jgi:hypothetical protein
MPLDHYVSQVHLKNFYSRDLSDLMYAIRKSDLKKFRTRSQDVCRIEDGSTNAYLKEDRAVEDFLKEIEPRYNEAIKKIKGGALDNETALAISGFAAYVATCSPCAIRLNSAPLKAVVESEAALLDKQGQIEKAPDVLGGKSITELLEEGAVKITIDEKFPQAIGISNILHLTSVFGNSFWEVLPNNEDDSPYFTSDFPAAMEVVGINSPINRLLPLAPDLAIRIWPDINLSDKAPDLTFKNLRTVVRKLKRKDVVQINKTIVRCAEDLLFYRDDRDWVAKFVSKNRSYQIEPITQKLETDSGHMLISTHRIRAAGESLTSFDI